MERAKCERFRGSFIEFLKQTPEESVMHGSAMRCIDAFAKNGFALDRTRSGSKRKQDQAESILFALAQIAHRPPEALRFQDTGDLAAGRPDLRQPVVEMLAAANRLRNAVEECERAARLEPLPGQLNIAARVFMFLEEKTDFVGAHTIKAFGRVTNWEDYPWPTHVELVSAVLDRLTLTADICLKAGLLKPRGKPANFLFLWLVQLLADLCGYCGEPVYSPGPANRRFVDLVEDCSFLLPAGMLAPGDRRNLKRRIQDALETEPIYNWHV